jgi:hypothetical protein
MKRRYWFVLILLFVGVPFFFIGGPGYHSARSFKTAWDLGHILFFCLTSIGLCAYFRCRSPELSPARIFLSILVVVFLLGFMAETLQMLEDGRSPDVFDILRDLLGGMVGCLFFCSLRRQFNPLLIKGLQVITVLFLFTAVWPLVAAVFDERAMVVNFPVLSEFESSLELSRWQNVHQLQRVTSPVRSGHGAMRVQLSTKKYSGVGLFYFLHDWSGYKWLHFSVFNPEEDKLPLHSRIHDRLHKDHNRVYADRYHHEFTLHPGWNDLQISLDAVRQAPADREMDMHNIEGFGIFVVNQARPRVIYVDHVYLSR